MNTNRGVVVINEHVLPITDVRFVGGRIDVLCEVRGPGVYRPRGDARVHGEDGVVMWASRADDLPEVLHLGVYDTMVLHWTLAIESVNGVPVRR